MSLDHNYIRKKSAEVIIECNVKKFPIDCFNLLKHYGYKFYSYSELYEKNKELYDMCMFYSEDAFRSGSMNLIAYNDKKPKKRIRFSLMHELGHHVLEHKNDTPENESEANFFANNMLAPRIAIYYTKKWSIDDISRLFNTSSSVAQYALQDFSKWCYDICHNGMHDYDKNLYAQFYDEDYKGFVYLIKKCEFCGANIYNSDCNYCPDGCKSIEIPILRYSCLDLLSDDDSKILSRLENEWLYGFL